MTNELLTAQDLERMYRTACLERDIAAKLGREAALFSRNICPQCGTKFGMQIIFHDTLEIYPIQSTELAYRSQTDPPDANWIWQPCCFCNPRDKIPDDFTLIEQEEKWAR